MGPLDQTGTVVAFVGVLAPVVNAGHMPDMVLINKSTHTHLLLRMYHPQFTWTPDKPNKSSHIKVGLYLSIV